MFPEDLPRQDHPLPKALDDAAAAKLLRVAHTHKRLLVRVHEAGEELVVEVRSVWRSIMNSERPDHVHNAESGEHRLILLSCG